MAFRAVTYLTAFVLAASASAAAAQPIDSADRATELDVRDRSSVSVTAGVFAPTGTLGIEYAHVLHPNLELAGGAGLGYLLVAAYGDDYRVTPHVALMPRARVRRGPVRLHAGAGVSAGQEQFGYSPFADEKGVDRMFALWAHAEGGVALVSRGGWFGRFALGTSHILAQGDAVSTDPNRAPMNHDIGWMPYMTVAIGRAL